MKFFHFKQVCLTSKFLFLDKTEIMENRDAKVTQAFAGPLSEDRDFLGFRNSANETYQADSGNVFMHLISRLDVFGKMPQVNAEGRQSEDVIRDYLWKVVPRSKETSESLVEACKEVLSEAITFLESELEIGVPNRIKSTVSSLKNTTDIIRFIEEAQGIKPGSNGPIICGLLKIADCIIEINKEEGFADLIEKSQRFEKDLFEASVDPDRINADKEKTFDNPKGFIRLNGENSYFDAETIQFDAKDRSRVIGKLLRKVGVNAIDLVNDGVRARIVVPEDKKTERALENATAFITGIPEYDFNLKSESKTNSAGNTNREDLVFIGTIPGTDTTVELVVQTSRNYLTHEHGIRNHEPYEWVQNFQIMSRLWGSVGRARFERKIKELAKKRYYVNEEDDTGYSISESSLEALFAEHFYLNPETNRYHWYQYDFRTNGTGVFTAEYQEKRNKGTIDVIMRQARDFDSELGDIPFNTWSEILNHNAFPNNEVLEPLWEKIINFLASIKGVPKLITACLRVQLNANKVRGNQNGAHPFQWAYIFEYKNWPENRNELDEAKVLRTLKRDRETFKFLIQILETKLKAESTLKAAE